MADADDDVAKARPAGESCPADRAAAIDELERECEEAESVRDRLLRLRAVVAAQIAARGEPTARGQGDDAEPGATADGGA